MMISSNAESHTTADQSYANSSSHISDLSDQLTALSTDCSAEEVEAYALSLQEQCRGLLTELEDFQAHLKERKIEKDVEIKPFRNAVQAEMKTLNKLVQAGYSSEKSAHALRSTNLSFYSAVWSIAKNSTDVVAFRKRFYWLPGQEKPYFNGKVSTQGTSHKQHSAVVDVVAQDGLEWIRVSCVTEKRILWDLAKAGWVGDESDEDDEPFSDEDDDPQGLLKQAEALKKAALATRVQYQHPSVRLVLPRVKSIPDIKEVGNILQKMLPTSLISVRLVLPRVKSIPDIKEVGNIFDIWDRFDSRENQSHRRMLVLHPSVRLVLPRVKSIPDIKEVGNILQKIRDLGVVVDTMDSIPDGNPPLASALTTMVRDPFVKFSSTLNVDCTILLAFASDLSHGQVEPEDWHNKAISRQIEMENETKLLPTSLWPACGNRKLVCTREAAVRMQEIVAIIGTASERRRTSLLLGLDPNDQAFSQHERIAAFQELSSYQVPQDWQIPLQIVDVDMRVIISSLPAAAVKLAEELSAINQSVFLYGWLTGSTTISSNRAVTKEIESIIEAERNGNEDLRGPHIWLMNGSRSLVGKEKQRKGFGGQ